MNPKYQAYLLSPEWKAKRKRILKRANNKCENCGSKEKLNVHHKTYKRIFKERDSDLIVLCQNKCHRRAHKRYYWYERVLLLIRTIIVFSAVIWLLAIAVKDIIKRAYL